MFEAHIPVEGVVNHMLNTVLYNWPLHLTLFSSMQISRPAGENPITNIGPHQPKTEKEGGLTIARPPPALPPPINPEIGRFSGDE